MKKLLQNKFLLLTLLVTFVCVFAWRLGTFHYYDDLLYQHIAPTHDINNHVWSEPCELPRVETLSDAFLNIKNHYLYATNGRMSNMYCILIEMLPRDVINVVDAIVMFAFFVMLFKAAGIKLSRVRARVLVLGVLCFWVAFPWYDFLQSTCFFDNYGYGSLISLALIYVCRRRKFTTGQYVAVMLLALVAGWWHEGFSSSLIAYLFFIWLLDRRYRNKKLFYIGVVVFVGFIIATISSTLQRFIQVEDALDHSYFYNTFRFVYVCQCWPAYVAALLTVALRLRLGKRRFAAFLPRTVGAFAAMAVCLIIALLICWLHRVLWALQLYATLQILMCADALIRYRQQPYGKVAKVALATLLVIYSAWSYELAKWQFAMKRQQNDLIEIFKKKGGPVAYYDLIDNFEIPFYLMGIPNFALTESDFVREQFAKHYVGCSSVLILPTCYEGMPLDSVKAPGDTKMLGAYPTFFSEDSLLSEHGVYCRYGVHARFTEPLAGADPISRLSMYVNKVDTAEIYFYFNKSTPLCVDGKTYYPYHLAIDTSARRMKNRKFYDVSTK